MKTQQLSNSNYDLFIHDFLHYRDLFHLLMFKCDDKVNFNHNALLYIPENKKLLFHSKLVEIDCDSTYFVRLEKWFNWILSKINSHKQICLKDVKAFVLIQNQLNFLQQTIGV